MAHKESVFDLLTGEITEGGVGETPQSQTITINDAISESAKVLVKEYGSDLEYHKEGKVDVRRFSNIKAVDVLWLMFFQNIPKAKGGDYAGNLCESYLNNRFSVEAQHKKMGIAFQDSISGNGSTEEKKDNRNWIQRNITQRKGKE